MTLAPLKHLAAVGSISHGTMRTEDLLPLFARELEALARRNRTSHRHASLLTAARRIERARNWESSDAIAVLDELFEALDDYAPMYCRFGAHEGDGADYGFWPIDIEDIKEQVREHGVVVSDLSEVPPRFNGEILLINERGNASLYVLARKKLKLIWSIV